MRLKAIELSGFRGFARAQRLDLEANAVILLGANGQGKTSLLDGIMWALAGKIPRLGDDSPIVSLYSESGQARVVLELCSGDGEILKVLRTSDGAKQHFSVEASGESLRGSEAWTRLLRALWSDALAAPDSVTAFTTAMTRSVYLQQDLVRQFIEADSDQVRFHSVSELVGAGRVTELQSELERARTAWTRATNLREHERVEARARLERLEAQVARLSAAMDQSESGFESEWYGWWNGLRDLSITVDRVASPSSSEAPTAVDTTIKQIDTTRRAVERRRTYAEELLREIETRSDQVAVDLDPLREGLEIARNELASAREALAEAEKRAAEERRTLVEVREFHEELVALAELALRHLGERCPVCGQTHDALATSQRLQDLVGEPTSDVGPPSSAQAVSATAAVVHEKERHLLELEDELHRTEGVARKQRIWIEERGLRFREVGIDPIPEPEAIERLRNLHQQLGQVIAAMTTQRDLGERLALRLTQIGEAKRRAEMEQELSLMRQQVEELDDIVRSREQTGALVAQMVEGLREAVFDVVGVQLKGVEPVFQRVYAAMDPHPVFRAVRFLSSVSRGRGRLATAIDDLTMGVSTDSPAAVLSSSQMNALAVAVFLAFNLGVSSLPLEAAMLDDPLQSLDDVNLLGMIDLLRRTTNNRQLVISTHDARFGGLLERKLRPVRAGQRTVVIEFTGWSREGPRITHREVAPEIERVLAVA